ncbi:Component of a membrane-bound complex containing the Tor2p kinase [Mucor velutinosus]|uniref:Protein YOP1 n=1 Tax=Mucor velutinosus TaxID=708070 RepID=A0AAN7DCS9_9FUNG|nr:Component of a membrane-bound complex containing the Tor2p kinase [Mucor velutinosus]
MITSAIYFCVKLGLLQLYPAYICYKAIKVNNQQEFGSLLTFWIVSITYLSIEYFSDIFLFWIPFYTECKLVIVLWLILPQTQGTSVFYTRYLDPFLHAHEEHIDNALLEIQAKLKETIVLYGKQLIESVKRLITDAVFKSHEGEQETTHSLSAEQTSKPVEPRETAIDNGTGGYIINPYNLFSTLITTAANRYQQQYNNKQDTPSSSSSLPSLPSSSSATTATATASSSSTPQTAPLVKIEAPTPIVSSGTTVTSATTAAEDSKLDRTDSHDSLQSYVNIKDGSSANTTPDLQNTKPATTESSAATWGGYLSSWVKKPSSSSSIPTVITEDKKHN